MIHLKPYSGSSTLSHLFNQAAVSGELIIRDDEFVTKANNKIRLQTSEDKFLIDKNKNNKIVIGIISKNKGDLPQIPFFSKVSFTHVKKRLEAYRYEVYIKNIYDKREKKKI